MHVGNDAHAFTLLCEFGLELHFVLLDLLRLLRLLHFPIDSKLQRHANVPCRDPAQTLRRFLVPLQFCLIPLEFRVEGLKLFLAF